MRLHTYPSGISNFSWGQARPSVRNIQYSPELSTSTIEQRVEKFQKNCAEKYSLAIAQIKKDFGWDLPEDEQNENDYQIAYQADWYEYALAQPLKNTIFLNMHSAEQKIRALTAWEEKIQDFIRNFEEGPADRKQNSVREK
jgi:hypothetical protein